MGCRKIQNSSQRLLAKTDEERLYHEINRILKEDDPNSESFPFESHVKAKQPSTAYAIFNTNNRYRKGDKAKVSGKEFLECSRFQRLQCFYRSRLQTTGKPKHLKYAYLPELLYAAGISYKQALEITNGRWTDDTFTELVPATLYWNNDLERQMCSVCDQLSQTNREGLYALILECLPTTLRELLLSDEPSGIKLADSAKNRLDTNKDLWLKLRKEEGLSDTKNPRKQPKQSTDTDSGNELDGTSTSTSPIDRDPVLINIFTYCHIPKRNTDTLPLYEYKKCVEAYDVSYHWLLGLDEKTTILAKKGYTEIIMDAFCLLPDYWKTMLYETAKQILSSGKCK